MEENVYTKSTTMIDKNTPKINPNKFEDKRFIRKKSDYYLYFMVISVATFVIMYLFSGMLKDALFSAFLEEQMSLLNIYELLTLFTITNVIWDILLLFTLVCILNVIIARILKIQVWRILFSTVISLIISIIIFHIIMYLWFYFGDPFGLRNTNFTDYLLNLITEGGGSIVNDEINEQNMIFLLLTVLSDIILVIFYETGFKDNMSFMNYILIYFLAKGFATNLAFEMGGSSFNPFQYEIWIEFAIYIPIFTIFFFKFVKVCTCVNEQILDDTISEFETEQIYKSKEPKEVKKTILIEKKGKTLADWEIEK